jgi:hypothetical protein
MANQITIDGQAVLPKEEYVKYIWVEKIAWDGEPEILNTQKKKPFSEQFIAALEYDDWIVKIKENGICD